MKQQITKEQWNEVKKYPTIGQLIKCLGDDLFEIGHADNWWINTNDDVINNNSGKKRGKELVDVLWEAVKEKLDI